MTFKDIHRNESEEKICRAKNWLCDRGKNMQKRLKSKFALSLFNSNLILNRVGIFFQTRMHGSPHLKEGQAYLISPFCKVGTYR